MHVGPVIVNNTPLVALWVLGRLDLMRELYDEVLIPQAVYDEFLATERAVRQTATPKETLTEIRRKMDKHIKNTYLKKVQAPVGVKSTLLAWMELV